MIETQPPQGAAAPAPDVIERLLRRSLLLLTRDRSIAQDWLDLAELAGAVGAPELAQLARDVSGLRAGFAPGRPAGGDTPVTSIDRAVGELRHLMAQARDQAPVAATDIADAVQACHTLASLLAMPLDAAVESGLAALLQAIEAAPLTDPRDHVGGGLANLVAAFAANEMKRFVRRHHALAFAPYGSAQLLHATARLGPGGLGPYLAGVRNIVRGSQDVIGLIAIAAGDRAGAMVTQWTVPLAACLPEAILGDVIDDLADLGLTAPLEGLLAAADRRTDTPTPLRRLRDAALDLGDLVLALNAQDKILAKWPHDATERRRAGDIRATAGDDAGARAAFEYALKLAPADAETDAHLAALRAGDFDAYAVTAGFETAGHRQHLRRARRAA